MEKGQWLHRHNYYLCYLFSFVMVWSTDTRITIKILTLEPYMSMYNTKVLLNYNAKYIIHIHGTKT